MMIVTTMHLQTHASQKKVSEKLSLLLNDDIGEDAIKQVEQLIHNTFLNTLHHTNNLIFSAVNYHLSKLGHQVRARLCLDACTKLGVNQQDKIILAAATELLHNASLVHDDIQDSDDSRRGQSTVWKKYGSNIGICAGDLLLSAAYGVLENYNNTKVLPKIIAKLHEKTGLAIQGQSDDVAFRDYEKTPQKISIEQYVDVAVKKSGALLSLPLELSLIAAENNNDINTAKKAAEAFAVGYQIADDLEDIVKDGGNATKNRNINIVFVLNELGFNNEKEQSIAMCHKYLNNAIDYAQKLPAHSGLLLVNLAITLKSKLSTYQ
jgi:geranylgeranyl pyrophosphate synthase